MCCMLKKVFKMLVFAAFCSTCIACVLYNTYYEKASARPNALCAFGRSFSRVCASFLGWGVGGWGGGLIAPCLLFQVLANDVHACVYIYIYVYRCIYTDR